MSITIVDKKNYIETWLKEDNWVSKKDNPSQNGVTYDILLIDNSKFQLFVDGNSDKVILTREFTLSPEFQQLEQPIKLNFLYELKIDLMFMNIHPKLDSNNNIFELKNFIFWDECIRNRFFESMYKMEQVIDLCKLKEKRFVSLHYDANKMEQ